MEANHRLKAKAVLIVGYSTRLLLSGIPTAHAQTVINPSFEAVPIASPFDSSNPGDVPGWTHAGGGDGPLWGIGYSDSGGNVTVAGAGNQFVTMGGGGITDFASWTQTVTGFVSGQTYQLSFKMSAEYVTDQSLQVAFTTGSPTPAQTFTALAVSPYYWQSWEQKFMTFTASTTSVTLEFSATVLYDVAIDDVQITAVPEPSTCAAFAGLGVLGFAAYRRRRRQIG